MDSEKQKKSKI